MSMSLFNILLRYPFIAPFLSPVATLMILQQQQSVRHLYICSSCAKQCLRCGGFCVGQGVCSAGVRQAPETGCESGGTGAGMGGHGTEATRLEPSEVLWVQRQMKGANREPWFVGPGLLRLPLSLLQGGQMCPVYPYHQGPSAGPASFPRKLGGSILWDLVVAKLQVLLWWVTAQCPTTTLLRHPSAILCACMTSHFLGGKNVGLEHCVKFCILKRGRRKIKIFLLLL